MNGLDAKLTESLIQRIDDEFTNSLTSTQNALSAVLETAIQELSAKESSILIPKNDDELIFYLSTNLRLLEADISSVPTNDSIAGIAMLSGQSISADEPKFNEIDLKTGTETKTYIATPILASNQIIGVMTLINRTNTEEPFGQAEMVKASEYAKICGHILSHNKNMHVQVQSTLNELKRQLLGPSDTETHDNTFAIGLDSSSTPEASRDRVLDLLEGVEDNDLQLLSQLLVRLSNSDSSFDF